MSSAQQIFNDAYSAYLDAVKLIETLGDIIRKADIKFSDNIAKREFDLMLQCILVDIATADGNFSEVEKNFIEKITDRADLINYLNSKHDVSLTWDMLTYANERDTQLVMRIVALELEDLIDDFVECFAAVDKLIEDYDICGMFTKILVGICCDLASVDGYVSENEKEVMKERIFSVFFKKWKDKVLSD